MKVRMCTYGKIQICDITKEYASLSTIYLEDFFTSLVIDAHEERDVVIFDVHGAYLLEGRHR